MAENDNKTTQLHPELPALQQVEAEGKEAAHEIARAFIRETLRNGGRIDLDGLERAGPTVQRAYRQMLAQVAARTVAPSKPAPTGREGGPLLGVEPLPANTDDNAALPRVAKGWSDRCCSKSSFKLLARQEGYLVGAVATVVAIVIFYFKFKH